MDLQRYSFEDCLLSALRSELESEAIYSRLAESVENIFLKDRFRFLATEEKKHQQVFENWFSRDFPDRELIIPVTSPVPLPQISITPDRVQISTVMRQAMTAEEAAAEFYMSLAELLPAEDERRKGLRYIAGMEKTHYKLLEIELDNVEYLESYNIEWPMMHIGP